MTETSQEQQPQSKKPRKQTTSISNVFQTVTNIMGEMGAVGKDSYNPTQKFKFRSIDAVYNELHRLFAKHGLFSTSKIESIEYAEIKTRNGGTGTSARAHVLYTFYALDGSHIHTSVVAEAVDYGDKASSKVMAMAHKYALLQLFMVPTEDNVDPDSQSHEVVERSKPAPKPKAEPKPLPAKKGFDPANDMHRNKLYAKLKEMGVSEGNWSGIVEAMEGKSFLNVEAIAKACTSRK